MSCDVPKKHINVCFRLRPPPPNMVISRRIKVCHLFFFFCSVPTYEVLKVEWDTTGIAAGEILSTVEHIKD